MIALLVVMTLVATGLFVGLWSKTALCQELRADQAAHVAREAAAVEALARAEARLAEAARAGEAKLAATTKARDEHAARLKRADAELVSLRWALAQAEAERDRQSRMLAELELDRVERAELEQANTALRARLEQANAEVSRLKKDSGRDASRTFMARMQALEQEVEALGAQVETWARRAAEAEAELARREALPDAAEREALRGRVESLEDAMRRVASARAALRSLGLPNTGRDAQIFLSERRESTESILRDAAIAAQAAGAGLFDDRGVSWARFGNAQVVERLAATASILASAPVYPALGRPVQLASELYGVYGRHLIALNGTALRLGVTGSREVPTLALRLAALQLVGLSPAPKLEAPEAAVLELDPARSDRLGAWAARRSALAVAVFGPGEPAGTDSVFAGACAPLCATVSALYARARRDGFDPGFAVIWRGEDDVTLAARPDGDAVVFAKFSAPPAPRVLDDLSATLRWLEPKMAAAS